MHATRDGDCAYIADALGRECVLVGFTYDPATCEHRCEIDRVELAGGARSAS